MLFSSKQCVEFIIGNQRVGNIDKRTYVLYNVSEIYRSIKNSEEQKHLAIRNEICEHNKSLAEAAKNAGVLNLEIMRFSRTEDIRDYMVVQVQKISIPEKDLKRVSRFLTIWEALNWLQIFSALLRQMKNSGGTNWLGKKKQEMYIFRLDKRFVRQ